VLGLLPIIGQLKCCGKELEPFQSIEDVKSIISEKKYIEISVTGNASYFCFDFSCWFAGIISCYSLTLQLLIIVRMGTEAADEIVCGLLHEAIRGS
jgi:hypothetical protein